MPENIDDLDLDQVLELVSTLEHEWQSRHSRVRGQRDLRYGRDDVLSTIPEELRATDFEYHSPALNEGILNLTAFLSAAALTITVKPQRDRDRTKADDLEGLCKAVFGANGILETESGGEVIFSVWEQQVESGVGCFKFHLKRDYPLRVPRRRFLDDLENMTAEDFEPNDDFAPRSRKDSRAEKGTTKLKETNASLDRRRADFADDEFAWQWRSVDERILIVLTQDGVPIGVGEIASRPASVLKEHDRDELLEDDNFVYMGEASPRDESQAGSTRQVVNTFEWWTSTHGYFGFLANNAQESGKRKAIPSGKMEMAKWRHPYGRPPYYFAYGLPSTDNDRAYKYTGAFTSLEQELPLTNFLETLHVNAVHRGYLPVYQPVREASGNDLPPLDNMEALVGVSQADVERTELPPGWKWEVMPSGFEPDLMAQLVASRERVKDSALNAVLTGTSPGAGDSGAKISLLIDAAGRSVSPFVRHFEAPLKEMAETMLRVSKALGLDLRATQDRQKDDGTTYVEALTIKASDIVSTAVNVRLDVALAVDQAAQETRGLTLVQMKMLSYETAAPRYFSVGDPTKEMDRIRLGTRDTQIDDIAFGAATQRFMAAEPAEFAQFVGQVQPPEQVEGRIGGGPEGAFEGASAALGQGRPALPGATQTDSGRPA